MDTQGLSFAAALVAGVLSFSSPCILPLVPTYLSYLAGSAVGQVGEDRAARIRVFFHALAFVLGFSLVFVALGASAGWMGSVLHSHRLLLRQVGGVVLVLLGLHVAGVFRIEALYRQWQPDVPRNLSRGYLASVVVGMVFAIGWTPCVGPILGGILLLAGTSETIWQGASLLGAYSIGMGVPFLLAGLLAGSLLRLLKSLNRYLRSIEVISGVMLVALGVLIFTGELERLSGMLLSSF